MTGIKNPLQRIFELSKDQWNQPSTLPAVRNNLRKVIQCRTAALGGEVWVSVTGEKVFYYTCKSKCCPSCGNRATLLWQREQWVTLPDIPFVGIVLTMPNHYWPIFGAHRHLQHDLPALGAAVLEQFAWDRYRVRVFVIVIQHTFGGVSTTIHISISWSRQRAYNRPADVGGKRCNSTTKRSLVCGPLPYPGISGRHISMGCFRDSLSLKTSAISSTRNSSYHGTSTSLSECPRNTS